MRRRWLFLCLCCLACGPKAKDDAASIQRISVSVSRLVNLTPPNPRLPSVSVSHLDETLRTALNRAANDREKAQSCGRAFTVRVAPQVLFGFDPEAEGNVPMSEWSSIVSITDRFSGTTSRVELSWLARGKQEGLSLDDHLKESLTAFTEYQTTSLDVLSKDPSVLGKLLIHGPLGQQKILLERLSLCPVPALDSSLGLALAKASDPAIRFRLVGLIGERKISALGDQLIDLIDLNDVEWTRAIVRTLSILEHRRTRELLHILSVHESPILQKEIKGASDRLERQREIP